jgi:hypothetical protein
MKLILLQFVLVVVALLILGRRTYVHFCLFNPAHAEFQKALGVGDLARAELYLDREQKYAGCGIDPFWFIDGTDKDCQ